MFSLVFRQKTRDLLIYVISAVNLHAGWKTKFNNINSHHSMLCFQVNDSLRGFVLQGHTFKGVFHYKLKIFSQPNSEKGVTDY